MSWWTRFLAVTLMLSWIPAGVFASEANASPQAKNVLILYSFTAREELADFSTLESTIRSQYEGPVNFQVEYLDSLRFDKPGYEQALANSLAANYRGQKIDLVMTALYPALQFAVKHREEIFPGAPVIFSSVAAQRLQGQRLPPAVTGTTINADVPGTIDLALRLQPDTKHMALIVDGSAFDHYWMSVVEQDLRRRKSGPTAIELVSLSAEELLKRIDTLPPDTVAYFQMVPTDSSQPMMGFYKLLRDISARLPTYCIQSYCMSYGVVGGSYADYSEQGVIAGEMAAKVLEGEKPENLPVVDGSLSRPHVDWRELQRWKMNEGSLPADAIVLHRPPGLWTRMRPTRPESILLAVAGIILLILGVEFWRHYQQKRRYRSYLFEGEQRFRSMTDAMALLIWMCDERGKVTYTNQAAMHFVGSDPVTHDWTVSTHPDDLAELVATMAEAIEQKRGFSKEFRLRRADGAYRWVLDVAAPRHNGDGSFAGLIGYGSDITDQKLAEEALRDVGGRMIEAQEQERSRIARELHDDICQKLALLSMELEMSKSASSAVGSAADGRIEEMRQHCTSIAADVQALSHELHSSRLDYLGLEVALESFCQEISQQQNINVDCKCENVPKTLTKAVSLSLFRIAQEGVHNSLKYSGTDRCSVLLRGADSSIELAVGDSGEGFDVEKAKGGKGLGLISMQERAHLVNGSFRIESAVGAGSKIVVSIPLTAPKEDGDSKDELRSSDSMNHFGKPEAATEPHR